MRLPVSGRRRRYTRPVNDPKSNSRATIVLKEDLFGRVELHTQGSGTPHIRRDVRAAPWWTRAIARRLAAREARILAALSGLDGIPQLLGWDGDVLRRSYLGGLPMHQARPTDPAYFAAARTLLARVHRRGVAHNDTAKEPNWLVLDDGRPGLIDYQLATMSSRRSAWFRLLGREDLRHCLKHKRTYLDHALTRRERSILAHRAWPSRLWMATVKPVYLWVTRGLFNWSDREGAGDRGAR